jgi:hypothetical protein
MLMNVELDVSRNMIANTIPSGVVVEIAKNVHCIVLKDLKSCLEDKPFQVDRLTPNAYALLTKFLFV